MHSDLFYQLVLGIGSIIAIVLLGAALFVRFQERSISIAEVTNTNIGTNLNATKGNRVAPKETVYAKIDGYSKTMTAEYILQTLARIRELNPAEQDVTATNSMRLVVKFGKYVVNTPEGKIVIDVNKGRMTRNHIFRKWKHSPRDHKSDYLSDSELHTFTQIKEKK